RLGSTRRLEQPLDLGAREHLGQLVPAARRAQLRRRVVVEDLLAAQVAVEGTQAGDLALDGGRRRRPPSPLLPGAELRDEVRELVVADLQRREVVLRQPGPELLEVGAVGLQRVARQAALELEVGEEV